MDKTKSYIAVIAIFCIVAYNLLYAGTPTTDLNLNKWTVGDTDYVPLQNTDMDTLDAAIPDKRSGKTAVFQSSVTFTRDFKIGISTSVINSTFTTSGNLEVGEITATSSVTASAFFGNGGALTGISLGDVFLASTQTFTGINTSLNTSGIGNIFIVTTNTVTNSFSIDGASGHAEFFVRSARARNSASITISNNTQTVLTFDTETWDTDNLFTVNGSSFVATVSGVYGFSCSVFWDTPIGGIRQTKVLLNGSTDLALIRQSSANFGNLTSTISTYYYLNKDDFLECVVFHSRGINIDVIVIGETPSASMVYVGNAP